MEAPDRGHLKAVVLQAIAKDSQSEQSDDISFQRAIPAASSEETAASLERLLQSDLSVFLEKYGRYLSKQDLALFDPFSEKYEVAHYLSLYRTPLPAITTTQLRNRRLAYLTSHLSHTDYFSPSNLRTRAPELYHTYIGQYEDDSGAAFPESMGLVDRIYESWEKEVAGERVRREREETFEEFDTESEEDGDESVEDEMEPGGADPLPPPEPSGPDVPSNPMAASTFTSTSDSTTPQISEAEREALAAEFTEIMRRRFIDGKDSDHFDYSPVDSNPDYGMFSAEARHDRDEAYFDADDDDGDGNSMDPFQCLKEGEYDY
ncbi:coiled-coil domain-containing protein-domain-containing protein [Fimicolochytrium jonesii]|uniref:coiled-coil domain-containing protein-domain-containing protein n=1 Tax=Fimicolochytrium jonesii TaxID=1396493 RepID=UPI0022FEB1C5|nr:coiled-coil domain-containing protein-domain-containing protein [Fimicolochytrium jonesii]KAI8822604.1 coiled-coil domain-containing protein-domain-containing protein [Fimicolochytrium jonesii]